jgi:hypothetical protein
MIFSSDTIDCFENARFVCYYLFLLCEYGINLEVGLGKYEAHSRESYQKACEYYKRTWDADAAWHHMPHYLTAEQAPVSTLNDLVLYLKLKVMSGHQYILASVFILFVKISVDG